MRAINALFNSYKKVLTPEYLSIYLIYFFFFLFNGPIETVAPLFINELGYKEDLYGLILSATTAVNIFLQG